jgi:hypothetical protein
MTLYINKDYYLNKFKGKLITEEDVEEYLELAQEKIDSITFNRIVRIGFNNLTEFQKEKIEKAICYQAEYIFEYGTEISNIASYSVLDINVSVSNKNTPASLNHMSEIAYDLIHKTGLDCRRL